MSECASSSSPGLDDEPGNGRASRREDVLLRTLPFWPRRAEADPFCFLCCRTSCAASSAQQALQQAPMPGWCTLALQGLKMPRTGAKFQVSKVRVRAMRISWVVFCAAAKCVNHQMGARVKARRSCPVRK